MIASLTDIRWDQIAVGVAAIVGLVYVARTLRGSMKDTLEFLANHLSGLSENLSNLTVATGRLADRIDAMAAEAEGQAKQTREEVSKVAAALKAKPARKKRTAP